VPGPGPVPFDPTGGSKRHSPGRPATSFGLLLVEATLGCIVDLDDDQIAYEFPCQLPHAPVVRAVVAYKRHQPLSGLSLVFAGKPQLGQLSRSSYPQGFGDYPHGYTLP
jgi:hypothetical protein